MFRILSALTVLGLLLFSTTDTFFIRTKSQQLKKNIFKGQYPTWLRTRSPRLGRIRTRFLELEQFPSYSDEMDISLDETPHVEKRPHYEDRGVVFPWNEWKCQVRGCRKRA